MRITSPHCLHLQSSKAVLLVNVAVALLLHPVLEDHGGAKNENDVDTDNAKGGGEDLVEEPVGKGRELTNATTLLRCNKRVRAGGILYKWRCG